MILAALLIGPGCLAHAKDLPPLDQVVATVDGVEIKLGHVMAMRDRIPPQFHHLPKSILLSGIIEQLVQQIVMAGTIPKPHDPLLQYKIENSRNQVMWEEAVLRLPSEPVSEEELREFYNSRFVGLEPEIEHNASHILVDSEAEAEAAAAELRVGADFADLAREMSIGPSAPNGGELGWFGEGVMVADFEDAVRTLEVGEVSDPVETEFGWHVIKLNDKRALEPPKFEDVRLDILAELEQLRIREEVADLVSEAEVRELFDDLDPEEILHGLESDGH